MADGKLVDLNEERTKRELDKHMEPMLPLFVNEKIAEQCNLYVANVNGVVGLRMKTVNGHETFLLMDLDTATTVALNIALLAEEIINAKEGN